MKTLAFLIVVITFLMFCDCETRKDCEEKFRQNYLNDLTKKRNDEQYYGKRDGQLLFLLKSPLDGHDELNHNFTFIANNLAFGVLEVDYFCDNSLIATTIVANYFKNVINLKVKNIYEDTHLPETLMYVGYSNIYKQCNEVWHCHIPGDVNDNAISINNVSKNNSANDTKETKALDFLNCTNEEKCEPTSYITVKVVSKNLEKYKELITLLEVLDENSNPMEKDYWSQHVTANLYKNSVVICADNYISHDGSDILAYKVVKDCNLSDFNNSNILGIIAPKPIDLMSRLPVPCIFYDVPKILPEYEYEYPNSAIVHENYDKHLTKAAVKLIELSKWIRVGILSDISAYSLDFEILLISALHEKNIAYSVKQCWDKTCDFHGALTELVEARARIIIVNVDEQYAPALVKTAHQLGLNAKLGYMWIWRGWPFKNSKGAALMEEVYSLSLQARITQYKHYSIAKSNIHKAFSAFNKVLYNYDNDFDVYMQHKSAKYSEIIAKIKSELDKDKSNSVVYLRKMTSQGAERMYKFVIRNNEVTENQIYEAVTFLDVPSTTNCAVRSNKFERPCDDYNLLMLILVIFCFLIILMLIYTFFTNLPERKQRYNNF